jgi:hypothetical protein
VSEEISGLATVYCSISRKEVGIEKEVKLEREG